MSPTVNPIRPLQVLAFTADYHCLKNVLDTPARAGPAFPVDTPPPDSSLHDFTAIWDTGATNSVITQQVVDALTLAPVGRVAVSGVHGRGEALQYLVSLWLPNQVCFHEVPVVKGMIDKWDIPIGMDIITQGDFTVSNFNNSTVLSFRMPSIECRDYVQN